MIMFMKETKGFLIIEAVFAVFVTLLIVLTLKNLLSSIKATQQMKNHTDEVAFAYVQLNNFIHDKDAVTYVLPEKSTNNKVVLCQKKNKSKKYYIINQYRSMIRATTLTGGHMPLLTNVKKVNFNTKKDQIKISLTEKDGRSSELYFKCNWQQPKKTNESIHDQRKRIA